MILTQYHTEIQNRGISTIGASEIFPVSRMPRFQRLHCRYITRLCSRFDIEKCGWIITVLTSGQLERTYCITINTVIPGDEGKNSQSSYIHWGEGAIIRVGATIRVNIYITKSQLLYVCLLVCLSVCPLLGKAEMEY